MEVYLDNAATTKPNKEIKDIVNNSFDELYANPSSLHTLGVRVEREIKEVKKIILKDLSSSDGKMIFTSGGTESNNLAIKGAVNAYKRLGKHIITTEFEHKSILNTVGSLEDEGFKVTYIKPNSNGLIELNDIISAIQKDTILVSIMFVNNEIGTLQPIKEIGKYLSTLKNKPIFHVDGVQAFMKMKINVEELNIDLFSFSAHKIHALKGLGGLYVKKGIRIKPLMFGGQQENSLRPGTENTIGIFALKNAVLDFIKNRENYYNNVKELKRAFVNSITSELSDVYINGDFSKASPYIVNIAFVGVKGEVLLHYLEMKKIYVSTGSACNSKTKSFSYVLHAINVPDKLKEGSIRFSFSKFTTKNEIKYALDEIIFRVNEYRSMMKNGKK
ncbi:cysteine desulfurase family protein [Helicovermis profundi]|uniref:cysteine desulfurase n=2 Tax=Helicovermis profundi TaxID=3065157 RepID=A0AAU9E7A1_9FIRM|nr:cysteine desulfurase family protein [Clostridia bacterium S502]